MKVFVIVGNLQGAVAPAKRLDRGGQASAFSQMRQDESQEIRADWELQELGRVDSARVVWSAKPKAAVA